ncbi:2-dehydropantoate 2-reductase [Pseudacidovorax sp. RU35E]|uniref:2-dehydropantoate 2-reductase n=1 Tax=Pseudacidovorax sp. RU35E TaxID=1907403 RepID=UPI000956852E|nr:2-dehydropantoate 2-reductase [Pseudacidovorax sp. RU35E]SIQ16765.1 ketopantoate reductase [Pseudacidovorax sp. RU35E]
MNVPVTSELPVPGEVLVMGAGAVGCYVGGCLAAAGVPVTFIGRPRVMEALSAHGLTLTDRDGARRAVAASRLRLSQAVASDARPALVLLTVKGGATAQAAAELAVSLPAGTPVLSLQNGIGNDRVVQEAAPALRALPGMVPYNIAELAPGAYHRGTPGRLAARDEAALRAWLPVFEAAGVPLDLHADMAGVQWGKLLLNLNNPVNALSGLPLRDELLDRGYRRCFAALIDEALAVLHAAGIEPAQMTAVPARRLPGLLRLPDWLFRRVAAPMLKVDAKARSSMADDVALGRRTEVDALCGAVVRLARGHGLDAPRNARMVALMDGGWPAPPPRLGSAKLRQALAL